MSPLLLTIDSLETLSGEGRVQKLKELLAILEKAINHTPLKKTAPSVSFLTRHPRLEMAFFVFLTGFVVFCDCFVGFATILSGVMTAGLSIFGLSILFASVLMGLFILLQLSAFSEKSTLSCLKPPKLIAEQIEEYALLKALNELMLHADFKEACQLIKITEEEYSALEKLILDRTKLIQKTAEELEIKKQSTLVKALKGAALVILGLSNGASGFSIGYFFVSAFGMCFPLLSIPFWAPLLLGGVLSIAVLIIFYDTQCKNVYRMVERVLDCDKNWIEAMTQDMMPRHSYERILGSTCVSGFEREEVPFDVKLNSLIITEYRDRLKITKEYVNEHRSLSQKLQALSI